MTRNPISAQSAVLYTGFGLLLVAIVSLGVFSYERLLSNSEALAELSENNHQKQTAAMNMRIAIRERAILLWHMSLTEDPFARDDHFQTFMEYGSFYLESHMSLVSSELDQEELILLERLDTEVNARAPKLRGIADGLTAMSGGDEHINSIVEVLSDQTVISNILDSLIKRQHRNNEQLQKETTKLATQQLYQIIVWMSIIVILGIVFARISVNQANNQADKLADANAELERIARHDPLTGLPNRLFMNDYIAQVIIEAKRYNKLGALLFIDLDGFKSINDVYGHDIGDKYLIAIAGLMQQKLRQADIVIRLGGDEFVIVLTELKNRTNATTVAEKLLSKLSSEIEVGGHQVKASASIGICYYPNKNDTVDSLLRCADDAMYQAKQQGKNQFHVDEHISPDYNAR